MSNSTPTNDHGPSTASLAETILQQNRIARGQDGDLYVFEGGAYRPRGTDCIKARVKAIYTASGVKHRWTSRKASEVIAYIAADAPWLWPQPPEDEINLLNGILHLKNKILRPHSPDWLSSIQLPVLFDPAASCPMWNAIMGDIFPPDCPELPYELVTWVMSGWNDLQKAVLLSGVGSNGKSAFLQALTAFLGQENVASVSLQKLEEDRFASSRLFGKLANIAGDIPGQRLKGTSLFKALTGGDLVPGERKFRESFEFRNCAKLIFSANTLPDVDDYSHGYFRRLVVVPFRQTYNEEDALSRSDLHSWLSSPDELSGVLNRALDVLPRFRTSGFSKAASLDGALAEYRENADPFGPWLATKVCLCPGEWTVKKEIYDLYVAEVGSPQMSFARFGRRLKSALPEVEDGQRTVDGRVREVYLGIYLR